MVAQAEVMFRELLRHSEGRSPSLRHQDEHPGLGKQLGKTASPHVTGSLKYPLSYLKISPGRGR